MTLLVRDEEDVLERMLEYHYALGVDFVIATDHRSTDRTPEILRGFEREGRLRVLRESSTEIRQAAWVTSMARLATSEHGADWVVNADADEFWWPRHASLRETLQSVPPRFGVLRGLWRHFVPRPEPPSDFLDRMTVRTVPTIDLEDPFHAQVKVIHRGDAAVEVSQGNHDAISPGLCLLREWFPFEVLHFPLRTAEQVRRKYSRPEEPGRWGARPPRHIAAAAARLAARDGESFYEGLLVDDDALARGEATGALSRDTRLRDAVRLLERDGRLPDPAPPRLEDEALLAVEGDAVLASDARLRLNARAARVQRRLDGVERSVAMRLARRAR